MDKDKIAELVGACRELMVYQGDEFEFRLTATEAVDSMWAAMQDMVEEEVQAMRNKVADAIGYKF